MKVKSPLSSRFTNLASVGLAAGLLAAGSPTAKAQSTLPNANETFAWSMYFTDASSAGSVFYPGAMASGTITFNPSNLTPDRSGVGFDAPAAVSYSVSYGGQTIDYSYSDLYMVYASGIGGLGLAWNGQNDGLSLILTPSSEPDTPGSIQAALMSAASGNYTAQDNSGLLDSTLTCGGMGPITSFQIEAIPEPGTLALGGFGAAALAAGRLLSRMKQPNARQTAEISSGI